MGEADFMISSAFRFAGDVCRDKRCGGDWFFGGDGRLMSDSLGDCRLLSRYSRCGDPELSCRQGWS